MANTSTLSKEERKKSKARIAQEAQDGQSAEAPRICPRFGQAQSEEDGTRHGEAVEGALGIQHLARWPRTSAKCQVPMARCFCQETRNPLAQPPTARTSDNQLLCCKSIDKLIAEADEPGHRLKKTLGPWSLTALGIGAIIGSGIFVLTGTAAAGEHFEAPSILHAQVLDLISQLPAHG